MEPSNETAIQPQTVQPVEPENTFELSDGTVVKFEPATVVAWMRARKLAGDDLINSSFYCCAEIARFNGEKKTLQKIKQLPLADGLLLESKFNELASPKK